MFTNDAHQKAHQAMENGNLELSIELYTKALLEAPQDFVIISDRAVAYLHLENEEKCLADFNRAVELQPNYPYRYASRAFAKNHFGNIDGAVEDYERAVKLDPTDELAHNNLGLLLEKKGYQKQADERFERAKKLSKMEDGLHDIVDEMEGGKVTENKANEIITSEPSSASEEFKKVFTSKSQFKEFLRFIKNGFKIR